MRNSGPIITVAFGILEGGQKRRQHTIKMQTRKRAIIPLCHGLLYDFPTSQIK
jgi:hypothetical protein